MTNWGEFIGLLLESHAADLVKQDDRRSNFRTLITGGLMMVFAVRPHFRCHYAYIQDLSARGFSFLSDHHLEPGSVLAFQYRPQDARPELTTTRLATVRHMREGSGGWLVGCELHVPITEDELGNLVD